MRDEPKTPAVVGLALYLGSGMALDILWLTTLIGDIAEPEPLGLIVGRSVLATGLFITQAVGVMALFFALVAGSFRQRWASTWTLIASVVNLPWMPVGTLSSLFFIGFCWHRRHEFRSAKTSA